VSRENAVFDPPPPRAAYVEICPGFSASESKHVIAALRDADREPPEPPHDHEHAEDGPRAYRASLEPGHYQLTGQDVGFRHSSDAV
jgi:hypothetical protein